MSTPLDSGRMAGKQVAASHIRLVPTEFFAISVVLFLEIAHHTRERRLIVQRLQENPG